MSTAAVSKLALSHEDQGCEPSFLLRSIRATLATEEPAAGELRVGVWRQSTDLCVLSLAGEMDLSNASKLVRALGGNVGSGRMIVDVSRLTFMDSSGIAQLVGLSRTVKEAGGAIVLAAPNPTLVRLFQIVNLGELMPVVGSLEAAIAWEENQHPRGPQLRAVDASPSAGQPALLAG